MRGKDPLSDRKCHFSQSGESQAREESYRALNTPCAEWGLLFFSLWTLESRVAPLACGRARFWSQVHVTSRPLALSRSAPHLLARTITHVPISSHFLHAAKPLEVLLPARFSTQLAIKLSQEKAIAYWLERCLEEMDGACLLLWLPATRQWNLHCRKGPQLFNAELQKD